ncbi:hypothetical protein [Nocardioides conyzicola]|uniref:DUF3592 domain-containing protein n=1 Tax=Nocardioides conyzicola TaxID=1651781 RepID=A0ABP8XCJ5_9ACTN
MKRRTRYVLVLVVAAFLVNLPLLHSSWTDRKVDRSGVDVYATVVDHRTVGGQHLVSFTFPRSIDPDQRTWQADVDATTYDRAVDSGELDVRVVRDTPSAYRADGQVASNALLVMTLVADVVLVLAALLLWRLGGRRRPQLRAIAVEDVERCAPGSALDRIEGETFLIRGEVLSLEPGQVVLQLSDRSVLVYLDGHHNAVGHQQPAQVRARLV